MKTLLTTICVVLAITLAVTSIAGASATSFSTAVLDWSSLSISYETEAGSIDWWSFGSGSYAYVENESTAFDYDLDESDDWGNTFADAQVPNASGTAWTSADDNEVGEEVSADTSGQGSFWALSDANAFRMGGFEAVGDGTLTITIDYSLEQTLSTETIGDFADGYAMVELGLVNYSLSELDSDGDLIFGGPVFDGNDFSDSTSGTLEVSLDFLDGNVGDFWAGVDNEAFAGSASAPPVPAPGAIVLSGIGVGLVGWLRRRRTL